MTDNLKEKNILLVDDDERNRFALSSYLISYDVHVLTARNGSEALNMLENGHHVDIILLDIMMPVLDGYEMLKILRKNDSFKHIPVIAVTARAMKGDKEKCLEAGAWDYISKPIDLKAFLQKLNRFI
jgi:two-component system, chemotaxis family, sensor kinase CheA